uniref:C2H2-type domain-containing protein n=1 Tax=Cyclopterus lumpus TaxID=8103 RepID=A0A8C2XLW5_CYCLU
MRIKIPAVRTMTRTLRHTSRATCVERHSQHQKVLRTISGVTWVTNHMNVQNVVDVFSKRPSCSSINECTSLNFSVRHAVGVSSRSLRYVNTSILMERAVPTVVPSVTSVSQGRCSWQKDLYNCQVCSIKFSSKSGLLEHQNLLHRNEKLFKCELCVRATNPSNPPKTYHCSHCNSDFPNTISLIHVRVHTGEKPYKCDICGKAFGQAYFLRVHELTHWSVKRYNCTRCEKAFTHYSNAKNHTCRPSGSGGGLQPNRRAKPALTYTCHICKNVFDHLQEFNSHMRAHTGAKLYRCLYCDKLFGVLSEIHRQRRGRFTCPQCGRGFRFVHSYKKHMSEHPEFQWIHESASMPGRINPGIISSASTE